MASGQAPGGAARAPPAGQQGAPAARSPQPGLGSGAGWGCAPPLRAGVSLQTGPASAPRVCRALRPPEMPSSTDESASRAQCGGGKGETVFNPTV